MADHSTDDRKLNQRLLDLIEYVEEGLSDEDIATMATAFVERLLERGDSERLIELCAAMDSGTVNTIGIYAPGTDVQRAFLLGRPPVH